jgi:RHS repeat-associated protein
MQGPYYNWNRWYLPSVGRYLELDPIAMAGGFNGFYGPNWYGYAEGNPLRWVDPWGLTVTCVYHQATGQLTCTDDQTGQQVVNHTGYAGHGQGVNNPNMQCVQNTGPLPTGTYSIGPAVNSPNTGPVSLPLMPNTGNNMCGRSAFRIHGNNNQNNQSASQGCIIMPPAVRNTINNSGGGTLTVQP